MPRHDGTARHRRRKREADRVHRRKTIARMYAILADPKRASEWDRVRRSLADTMHAASNGGQIQ